LMICGSVLFRCNQTLECFYYLIMWLSIKVLGIGVPVDGQRP
jgi:hypothetical protein